jgi:cell division septal protein FtsQ
MSRGTHGASFSGARDGRVKAQRFIVSLLVVFCLSLSGIWFLFVSRYWSIARIETNDLHTTERGEVEGIVYDILDHGSWKPWDTRNIFFVDEGAVANALRERLFAEKVVVDKVYPNILRLMITERQRSVVLASKDQLLLVDTNGVVTSEAADGVKSMAQALLSHKAVARPQDLPVVVIQLPEPMTTGYQVTKAETVRGWITAYKTLNERGVAFEYLSLESPGMPTLEVYTNQGYKVIFDVSVPLEAQIESYKAYLKTQGKKPGAEEYIDVRVPGKVFVK